MPFFPSGVGMLSPAQPKGCEEFVVVLGNVLNREGGCSKKLKVGCFSRFPLITHLLEPHPRPGLFVALATPDGSRGLQPTEEARSRSSVSRRDTGTRHAHADRGGRFLPRYATRIIVRAVPWAEAHGYRP